MKKAKISLSGATASKYIYTIEGAGSDGNIVLLTNEALSDHEKDLLAMFPHAIVGLARKLGAKEVDIFCDGR